MYSTLASHKNIIFAGSWWIGYVFVYLKRGHGFQDNLGYEEKIGEFSRALMTKLQHDGA